MKRIDNFWRGLLAILWVPVFLFATVVLIALSRREEKKALRRYNREGR